MKLTIEKLGLLSAQDKIDLAKIWPDQQLSDWQLTDSLLSNEHKSGGEQQVIFAARFNDRLLGAVKVSISHGQAELSDLCVREVTRRRGVGLYLIEDLQQQLPDVKSFSIPSVNDNPVFDAFMHACGFKLKGSQWHKSSSEPN